MAKKILLGLAAVLVVVAGVAAFSAFEAHIINVTARIENALVVPIKELDFGTVFPQEYLVKSFTVALSNSFQEQAQCSVVNLIQNGNFESPEVTDPAKWDIFEDGTAGLVWTIEWRGDIPASWGGYDRPDPALKELHEGVNGWLPYEGDQYAELDTDWYGPGHPQNGEPASVRIYQDISTTPGRKYQLTFAFSPRPNTPAGDNILEVKWDGGTVATIGPIAGDGNTNWTLYTYEVAASSNSTRLEFIDKGNANSLGTFLDDVTLVECGRVTSVDYVLRQKPKCVDDNDPIIHPPVIHEGEGFYCPEGSHEMPLLCPYLSKEEITQDGLEGENDGVSIPAFHEFLEEVTGRLSFPAEDLDDEWLIDLDVPCFEGMCAQDWGHEGFELDPEDESEIFGCDLWLEVTRINGVE